MKDCDVVDNVACGVRFQYCRTHKVEPKDCPQNAPVAAPDTLVYMSAPKLEPRKGFQVGDVVVGKGWAPSFLLKVVEGQVNQFGTSKATYENRCGPCALCSDGFFYPVSDLELV